MLENEPDTNDLAPTVDAPASASAPQDTAPEPPKRPRRRAASRPAGPPASASDVPPIQRSAPESEPIAASTEPVAEPAPVAAKAEVADSDTTEAEPAPEASEPAAPVKRAARKAPAKRAPAKKAAPADSAEEPKARAPRKRVAKKAAPAAEESIDELLVPAGSADAAPATPLFSNVESGAVVETQPVLDVTPTGDEAPPEHERVEPESVPAEDQPAEDQTTIDQRLAELAARVAEQPDEEAEAALPNDEAAEPDEDDVDAADSEQDQHDVQDDEGSDDGNRRRRRRRGGRRRRRTGADDDAADPDAEGAESSDADKSGSAQPDGATPTTDDSNDAEVEGEDADPDNETQRRRRRRRRRRGEDAGSAPDDPTEVVVRVREPRRAAKPSNEVTGIEGSTRMEAKRQRRRDGREAGRRRPPILSEAEFLARREAVSRKMIIRQRDDLSQIAVLEDDILVEHYVDRDSAASLIGNVYLGRVQNVLPSMEAAFIDIGRGRNAVLYAGEVDWDSFGADGHHRKVERVLKSGQPILVQVSKDPIGAKGARLTNNVSIPGRYIVYSPSGHLSGISRKLPDIERKRLRDILADLVGESASVIVRTAAEGASEEELVRDVNRLQAQWADIERKVASGTAPQLLYGEPDLTVRIVRDLFTEDFSELIIDGNGGSNDAYDAVDGYVTHVAPHLKERMRRWDDGEDSRDVFAAYRLDEQIAKALERKVFLPSGGSLVIDRTEAMTVIDVNTGKFTGSGGNLEATVTSNNLEAAEEIVNQLRLRDIGGIIVIDFIDMVLPANRELLLRRLVECLGRDRTRHQVAEVTSLGLVQMTRKKLGTGLLEAFTSECPHCLGRGVELHDLPVESQQQADGGTREPRPRDQRRGGGQTGPKPSDSRSTGQSNGQSTEPRSQPVQADAAENGTDSNSHGEERSSSGRSRRGGGRSRRGSGRDQSAAADSGAETSEVQQVGDSEQPLASEPQNHEQRESQQPESHQPESHQGEHHEGEHHEGEHHEGEHHEVTQHESPQPSEPQPEPAQG